MGVGTAGGIADVTADKDVFDYGGLLTSVFDGITMQVVGIGSQYRQREKPIFSNAPDNYAWFSESEK